MAPPRNVVKIAVQMRDAIPQLIQLDQAKPLATVLKEVCDAWSLTHSERYALQFADGHRRYITENNRTEIKNGSILCLSTAPVMPLLAHPLLPCPFAEPLFCLVHLCPRSGGPGPAVLHLVATCIPTFPVLSFLTSLLTSAPAPAPPGPGG